jgi:hypothetical protein
MALRLASHLRARVAAAFLGFFAGFAVFALLVFRNPHSTFGLNALLFFGLLLGGAYLGQLAFSRFVPAACPACGSSQAIATASLSNPVAYVCRACGAERSAAHALHAEQLESVHIDAVRQAKTDARLAWMLVAVGAGCLGIGIWLAQDAIGLLRDGVSTPATVLRVTNEATRDKDGDSQTTYTAVIQYHAGKVPLTFERSWSVPSGGRCLSPCYAAGESLQVIYLPADPNRAKVHSLTDLFMAPGIFGAVGLVFTVFGAVMVRQRRRGPAQPGS